MSAKPIREFDGKLLLSSGLDMQVLVAQLSFDLSLLSCDKYPVDTPKIREERAKKFSDHCDAVFKATEVNHPWILTQKLVCKPDQLIKRRGKNGLLGINLDWKDTQEWIKSKAGKNIQARSLL